MTGMISKYDLALNPIYIRTCRMGYVPCNKNLASKIRANYEQRMRYLRKS